VPPVGIMDRASAVDGGDPDEGAGPDTVVYGQRSRETMEGHAMVLTGGIRVGTVAVAVMVASCAPATPSSTASPTPHATAAPRPSAATGPCASVMTTTPIGQVPAACAVLWAPYGVTKVPPANLTDATPVPPPVVNGTHGVVTDAVARRWAQASNRAAIWYRWAEANDQPKVLAKIGVISLIPTSELQVLAANGTVSQPDCALFPTRIAEYQIGADAMHFFGSVGQHITGGTALVDTFPGPCTVTATTATGQSQTIASYPASGITFFAGHDQTDPVLGDVWFTDGAGNCGARGAPVEWCT
jgi:hypothetical protein